MLRQAVARASCAAERDTVEEAAGVFSRRGHLGQPLVRAGRRYQIDQRDAVLAGSRLQRLRLLRRQVGYDQSDDARLGCPLTEGGCPR